MTALTGHQADTTYAKYPRDLLQFRLESGQLSIQQVRDVQVDRISMLATHLPPSHIEAIVSKVGNDIPQDTDTILAMKSQTHDVILVSQSILCHDGLTEL